MVSTRTTPQCSEQSLDRVVVGGHRRGVRARRLPTPAAVRPLLTAMIGLTRPMRRVEPSELHGVAERLEIEEHHLRAFVVLPVLQEDRCC